jgi:hypothetical protein
MHIVLAIAFFTIDTRFCCLKMSELELSTIMLLKLYDLPISTPNNETSIINHNY